MANTCFTSYVCVGSEDEIEDLYLKMRKAEENFRASGDWDVTRCRMDELVKLLGGKLEDEFESCHRGRWYDLEHNNGVMRFETLTPWNEFIFWREFIEEQYSTLKFYYKTEEPGEGLFFTNDSTGRYFPNRYEVGIENQEIKEFPTANEAEAFIATVIGRPLAEGEDPDTALRAWSDKNNISAYYYIFDIEDY